MKNASIKDVRQNLADFADAAEKGEIITVFRRSKASFKIIPVPKEEMMIDVTEDNKKEGIPIQKIVQPLEDEEEYSLKDISQFIFSGKGKQKNLATTFKNDLY